MQPQPLKTTLIMATLFTLVVVLFVTYREETTPQPAAIALNAAMIFVIIFATMRLTNRLTAAAVNRFARPERRSAERREPDEPPEPSSSRPEHAQRRRQRRRPRGRRRHGA